MLCQTFRDVAGSTRPRFYSPISRIPATISDSLPFATFKQSGVGVDKSLHALDKYTRLKTTWINL